MASGFFRVWLEIAAAIAPMMQARARLCSAACNCFLWGLHAQTARRSGFPRTQAGILREF